MTWTVDPTHTTVGFSAKHLGISTVRGRFNKFEGEFEINPDDPTSAKGRVEVDASSLDTGNEQRDGHLRGPDFFDVEQQPKITFVVKSIAPRGGDNYTVTGDLTIKGITREVALDYEHEGTATDPYGNHKIGGSLSGTIERSQWGLKWNVPLGGGGLLVSEKIKIDVEGQLAESRPAVASEAAAEARTST